MSTSLEECPHWGFAGHAIELWFLRREDEAISKYKMAIEANERWQSDIYSVAQEYNWTDEMIELAKEACARCDK